MVHEAYRPSVFLLMNNRVSTKQNLRYFKLNPLGEFLFTIARVVWIGMRIGLRIRTLTATTATSNRMSCDCLQSKLFLVNSALVVKLLDPSDSLLNYESVNIHRSNCQAWRYSRDYGIFRYR